MATLLVLSRAIPDLRKWLSELNISVADIFGEPSINAAFAPLFLPGGILIICALIAAVIQHREAKTVLVNAFSESTKSTLKAGLVLVFTIPMVRIFINSGVNVAEIVSMPVASATLFAGAFGDAFPLISPTIGALGAFIAGSNTVSNLMFSQFQYEAAIEIGLAPVVIVAVQAVGAAAGNMIAIHNVVAASAVVGMIGKEGVVIRHTILPMLYYVSCVGIIAFMMAT